MRELYSGSEIRCPNPSEAPKMVGMHHALIVASRIIAFGAGLFLSFLALLLKDSEEKNLKSFFEALWVKVDDREKLTNSTPVALFNVVARLIENFINRVFGPRLSSPYVMVTSLNLSFAGSLIFPTLGGSQFVISYLFFPYPLSAIPIVRLLLSLILLWSNSSYQGPSLVGCRNQSAPRELTYSV